MKNDKPTILFSNAKGKIFTLPAIEPAGMKAGKFFRLDKKDLIKLPPGSRLFRLPDRCAVGYDRISDKFVTIDDASSVAAFAPPGYTLTYSSAYTEKKDRPRPLPLFSYGACASLKGELYMTAILVDRDKRHDARFIDLGRVKKNVPRLAKLFPKNRLVKHLADCALIHGCPNAQNLFLGRYEAPLPTSPKCNAACAGCISYQPGVICASQPRIKFIPTAREISEIAVHHIDNVKNPIVSFGQGCEGEPLLCASLIEESIAIIRSKTKKGTININTNGSLPRCLSRLFAAGLDSARISMNSAQHRYYTKYYSPRGYSFSDVVKSIGIAKKCGFISINYLTMPGFTDSQEEFAAFERLIRKLPIDMIQWRNLNYDPLLYFREIEFEPAGDAMGIREMMSIIKRHFPKVKMGYFNPRVTVSPHR